MIVIEELKYCIGLHMKRNRQIDIIYLDQKKIHTYIILYCIIL